MKRHVLYSLLLVWLPICSLAQISVDDSLKKPLKQVLTEVQARFHVQIKFDENLVKGQVVSFADWRIRPGNIDKTLNNILTPLDISYTLKAGVYSLRKFD